MFNKEDTAFNINILIFGGTSEGRRLAELLSANHIKCSICVATEYGEKLLPSSDYIDVKSGRMDLEEIKQYLFANSFSHVIDATHPYASIISNNAKTACEYYGINYIRLIRNKSDKEYTASENIITVKNINQAAALLNDTEGNIFLTTGSKELIPFCKQINDTNRIIARVLPTAAALDVCSNAGLCGKQIIAMQGPFSKEINLAMFKQTNARYLVTKDGGNAGGFSEKITAATEAGITVILIERPVAEEGYSINEILDMFKLTLPETIHISLVGSGMGNISNTGTITLDAVSALKSADLIIGAKRLIKPLSNYNIPLYAEYDAAKIRNYIVSHPQYKNIAIILSGDIGFYSGAKKLIKELSEYDITLIPGISSLIYFCSRLKTDWQDTKLISLHGRTQNIITAIRNNKKVFALVNKASLLAKDCMQYRLTNIKIHLGINLGFDNEKILTGTPDDFISYNFDGLCVALIINEDAENSIITHGISDNNFIRGDVPITKEEIRAISLSKLKLTNNSIVYDIGAGTGSISVECANQTYNGTVYAIEKNQEAIELIMQNKFKLSGNNLIVVKGTAPDAIKYLKPPTHVFIGGSSGNMRNIIDTVLDLNPNVKIVINIITLETLSELTAIINEKNFEETEILLVNVSKSKKLGSYNMMTGQNPVYIITLQNKM